MKPFPLLGANPHLSFRATTQNPTTRHSSVGGNPALKSISRFFALIGLLMMFAVSGWGGGGNNNNNSNNPTVSLSCTPASLYEGNTSTTTVSCVVSIDVAPDSSDLKLTIKTSNDTAKTSDSDYVSLDSDFTFQKNTNTKTKSFTITINGDTTVEPDETFEIEVKDNNTDNNQDKTLPSNKTIITILNDDSGSGGGSSSTQFSIAGTSVQEGNNGTTSLPFVVTLSGLTCPNKFGGQTFTVNYATSDGTATTANSDYKAKNGTLTFAVQSENSSKCKVKDGSGNELKDSSNNKIYISSSNDTVYQSFTVSLTGDTTPEPDENLTVTLSNASSGTGITTAIGTGTIQNDDITDVTMTKSASPTSVGLGGVVTYSMQALYVGSGNSPSGSIKITDPLPSGMTYVSYGGTNWNCTGSPTVVCTYNAQITSGSQSSTLTIQATAPNTIGTIDNIATVSTTSALVESSTATSNNTAHAVVTVLSSQVDMVLTKTATSSVAPSGAIVYTLRGTNNGKTSASGISIVDHFPAGVGYGSKSGTNWTCASSGSVSTGLTVTCTYSTTVTAGSQTNLLTLNATAPSTTGSITNNATISTTSTESSTTNNSASASTTVSATAVSYTSDNPRVFDIIYTANMNGDIKMIGNSVLCKDSGDGQTCIAPDVTKPNNSTDTLFYTLASDSADNTIFNSSSYALSLPSGVKGSDVLWAGLYWQGEYKGKVTSAWMDTAKNIKLKAPGDSAYRDLTAETTGNRFNWMVNGSNYLYYQGARDITSVVQGGGSGTYQVANVQTSYGTAYSPGHFGGWAIALVYKDLTTTLKNMTVYDGYSAVDTSNPLTVNTTGFLTPSSGTVESKFTIFATEGDISYTADKLTLSTSSGTNIPVYTPGNTSKNNPFNSSISDETGATITTREPSYPNMIGVDIHTYNVGTAGVSPFNILGAGQTSTNINLSTGDDVFNPGAFAFSTQLYIPDVCYTEDVYYNNALISSSNIPPQNGNVTYEVGITNKNNEVAKGVFIEKVFDKPREISYVAGSMSIDTVNKTDTISDDTAEFSTDTNTSKFLLGVGAVAGTGGTIAKDFLTKFKYQAKIGDQNASENNYLVSYRNDQLGVTFNGIPIRKCVDFNNSFSVAYNANPGGFNMVDAQLNTGTALNAGSTSVKYNLPTQIANRPTNLKIVSFDPVNLDTVKATSAMLAVEIIDLSPYPDTTTACNTADSNITNRAWVLMGDLVTNVTNVDFNKNIFGTGFNTGISEDSFYGNARKNAAFRISWNLVNDNNDTLKVQTLGANSYKLANFPSYGGSSCQSGFIPPNGNSMAVTAWCGSNGNGGGNSGMTADELHVCMECVYGLKTNKVCSRDNFAIRPEAFNLQIKDPAGSLVVPHDANLSAGYSYRFDVNATNHKNANSTAGYTLNQNVTLFWSPNGRAVNGCNDLNDKNVSFPFANGAVVNQNLNYANVGRYELKIRDTNWTVVDQATPEHHTGTHWQTGGDCVDGSDVVPVYDPNNTYETNMVGCEISSQHDKLSTTATTYSDYNLTFRPYTFDISNIQMTKGTGFATDIKNNNNVWTYMHDLNTSNQMGVRYSGQIKALGQGGVTLNNFVTNCYAEPVKLDANLTFPTVYSSPAATFWRYRLQEKDLNGNLWRDTNASVLSPVTNSSSPYVAIPSSSFLKDKNGTIGLDLTVNFDRNQTTPFNPITVQMQNLQIKCQISGNCSSLATNKTNYLPDTNLTTNSNATFIYGRIIPRDIRVFGNAAFSANAWYEVYNAPTLAGQALSPSRNDAMWYINKLHNDTTDGDANVTMISPTPTGVTLPITFTSNGTGLETYNISGQTPPYSAKAHIQTVPWLWYGINASAYANPGTDCLTHPCFNINIVPPIGVSGSAKDSTTSATKTSKQTTKPTGLIYDYAPATR